MSFFDREIGATEASKRNDRRPRLLRARMAAIGRSFQDVLIRNVSSRGLGGASRGEAFAVGEQVEAELPGGAKVRGVVRWAKAKAFGVELDEELDMQALGEALRGAVPGAAAWEVHRLHRVAGRPAPSTVRSV